MMREDFAMNGQTSGRPLGFGEGTEEIHKRPNVLIYL